MTEPRCGRCGYQGEVWPGRYGGVRCWVCYGIEQGNPPVPPPADGWEERVRRAFADDLAQPEPYDALPDPWALFKYNGRLRRG